jgi:GT2 family glycosyltransferase
VPETPLISAIVVSYNTRQMTLDCLAALQAALRGTAAEVWVVDNASADGSPAAVAAAFPDVRLIRNPRNVGFGAANNQALRACRGEYVLLLNSDAFLAAAAVATLLGYLREHPDVGVVGPKLLNADGSLQRSCYRFPSPWRAVAEGLLLTAAWPNSRLFGDYRAWAHDATRDVDMIVGACMLLRRSAVERVGAFDEAFFLYAEETDLCFRMRRAGLRVVFLPAATATHLNGGSGARQPDRVFCEFRRGQERFYRKHYGRASLAVYRAMIVVGACLRLVAFAAIGACSATRRQRCAAELKNWARILTWTLGRRGAGLRELGLAAAAPDAARGKP